MNVHEHNGKAYVYTFFTSTLKEITALFVAWN